MSGIAQRRVAIAGLGRTGRRVLQRLVEEGIRCLHLADGRAVGPADLGPDSVLQAEDLGLPRSEALAHRWRCVPGLEIVAHAGPGEDRAWGVGWLPDLDLCLLAGDRARIEAIFRVNRSCLDRGVALLPALVSGEGGLVGPLVRRGAGPCLRCVDLRVTATLGRSLFEPRESPAPELCDRVGRLAAGEAAAFLTGREGVLSHRPGGGGDTLIFCSLEDSRRHPILRTSRCPDCARFGPFMPYRFARSLEPSVDAEGQRRAGSVAAGIVELRPRLVSRLTGPVRSLERFETEPGDPQVEHWHATLTDVGEVGLGGPHLVTGAADLEARPAMAAALGEAFERLPAIRPRRQDLLVASFDELGDDAVDPRAFDLFHPDTRRKQGFPYGEISSELPMSWLWGWSLSGHRPRAIPASRVFVTRFSDLPGDAVDDFTVSGFACGDTLEEALRRGLLEVLERDAFMIAWLARLPLKRLDPAGREPLQTYLDRFATVDAEARCACLYLDLGVHLVIAIRRSTRPDEPCSVVAAAADGDLSEACRRALKELALSTVGVRRKMLGTDRGPSEGRPRLPEPDPRQILTMRDHSLLFARRDMATELDLWWNPRDHRPLPDAAPGHSLATLVEGASAAGLEVLAVDLTPPEIRDLGLRSMKVLVPGTYPMTFDSRWPHLGGRRLYEAPVAAGVLDRPRRLDELNPVPHPFP